LHDSITMKSQPGSGNSVSRSIVCEFCRPLPVILTNRSCHTAVYHLSLGIPLFHWSCMSSCVSILSNIQPNKLYHPYNCSLSPGSKNHTIPTLASIAASRPTVRTNLHCSVKFWFTLLALTGQPVLVGLGGAVHPACGQAAACQLQRRLRCNERRRSAVFTDGRSGLSQAQTASCWKWVLWHVFKMKFSLLCAGFVIELKPNCLAELSFAPSL